MSQAETKPDGGPAFPRPISAYATGVHTQQDGMSLRDYFAANAIAFWAGQRIGGWVGDLAPKHAADIAKHCYIIADAMLAERTK